MNRKSDGLDRLLDVRDRLRTQGLGTVLGDALRSVTAATRRLVGSGLQTAKSAALYALATAAVVGIIAALVDYPYGVALIRIGVLPLGYGVLTLIIGRQTAGSTGHFRSPGGQRADDAVLRHAQQAESSPSRHRRFAWQALMMAAFLIGAGVLIHRLF